jgi:hypothetical protein
MSVRGLIIVGIIGAIIVFALATCPYEGLASFDPVEWISNSVNGFFDWIINLFFGWIK